MFLERISGSGEVVLTMRGYLDTKAGYACYKLDSVGHGRLSCGD